MHIHHSHPQKLSPITRIVHQSLAEVPHSCFSTYRRCSLALVLSLCSRDYSKSLVLSSWNSFCTYLSHLLATYTELLLSYRSWYLVAFSIGIPAISVSYLSVLVSFASLRTHFFESAQVSITIGFISLHSLYPHQYHHYSYTPTNLFILTHTFIPCVTRLLWAIHRAHAKKHRRANVHCPLQNDVFQSLNPHEPGIVQNWAVDDTQWQLREYLPSTYAQCVLLLCAHCAHLSCPTSDHASVCPLYHILPITILRALWRN
jgi:hypothetical protein